MSALCKKYGISWIGGRFAKDSRRAPNDGHRNYTSLSLSLSLSFSLSRLDVKRSRSSGNAFHECRNGWKYHRYRELVENSFFFFHVHKSPRTSDLIYRSRSFTFGDRAREREREKERKKHGRAQWERAIPFAVHHSTPTTHDTTRV